jgi:hypothetical protein
MKLSLIFVLLFLFLLKASSKEIVMVGQNSAYGKFGIGTTTTYTTPQKTNLFYNSQVNFT